MEAIALLDEAISLFLNGEPETARLVLRDLVNATIGFEGLAMLGNAIAIERPSKSPHRMISVKGNSTMDDLTMIFAALRRELKVEFTVRVAACAWQSHIRGNWWKWQAIAGQTN
jgi:hypothetical protein